MNIRDFCELHGKERLKSIQKLMLQWAQERELDKLLHTQVAAGVVLGDLLVGDGLIDKVSPELRDAFATLMKEKADSYHDVRMILLEKLENGDASVLGLVNKIKGQVGENRFIEELGGTANMRLASAGNQEGWDVAIEHDWGIQYVQVKMHSDANGVIQHMQALQDKLDSGNMILDGDRAVERIDFAVPADIMDEVARKAQERGLDMEILPINMTATQAADVVWDGVNNVGPLALENFFDELLGVAGYSAVGHGAVSAFMVYKGAKQREEFLGEVTQNTAITVGGATAGGIVQLLLCNAGMAAAGPVGALVLVSSIGTRSVLRRFAERTDYVEFLQKEQSAIRELSARFS